MEQFERILRQLMTESKELLPASVSILCVQRPICPSITSVDINLDAESASAEKMFKNGTLSIGFIGLWDALSVLSGKVLCL